MRRLTNGTERCGRGALRATALLTFLIALLAVPATAGAATAGGLKQLAGTNGCLTGAASPPSDCGAVRALQDLGDIALSPDGLNAYVTSRANDALIIFNRNPSNGTLTQKAGVLGCATTDATVASNNGCNLVPPFAGDASIMDGPQGITVSPDGKTVYFVTNSGRITGFNRASDGTITFNDSDYYTSAGPLFAVAVSPDGKSVYMAGQGTGVGWYRRNTNAGAPLGDIDGCCGLPDQGFQGCYGGACGGLTNFGTISALQVTGDNKELLMTGTNSVLFGWDRDTSTGALTATTTGDRCVGANDMGGTCQTRQGMITAQSLVLADGGTHVYVGSQQALVKVDRNASTNVLTPDTAGNCFAYPQSSFAGCTPMPGSSCCTDFYPAREVIRTPDGQHLYYGTESSNPSIFGFTRTSSTLTRKPTPLGCVNVTPINGCAAFRQGNRVQAMTATNSHVYAVGNDRLFAFAIDRPPVCSNVNASTGHGTSVTITLSCSDPDGDALTFSKVSDPARGSAGGVQGNRVTYSPFADTTGQDSFTYRATAAGVQSDVATVTVDVAAASTGGGGVVGPSLIPSTVTNKWLAFPNFTKASNLSVKNLLAGTTVRVTCKTKKKSQQKRACPYKSRRVTTAVPRATLNLVKPFRKRRLPVGTKVTITITVPGQIGKQIRYTVRRRAVPKVSTLCIPPGGSPGRCV
jgi:hypothetical protein